MTHPSLPEPFDRPAAPRVQPPYESCCEPFPEHYNDLAGSLAYAWRTLGRATKDRRSAFHAPVVATQSADGPQARVMILRTCDVNARVLTFHTDTRSAKAAELAIDPRVTVVFYDAARKLQLRAVGTANVHHADALAATRWTASSPRSLRCFLGAQPGDAAPEPTSGLPDDLNDRVPDAAELAHGQPHFAVLCVTLQRMEWLYLHTRGQRRARYDWTDGDCTMTWLNP